MGCALSAPKASVPNVPNAPVAVPPPRVLIVYAATWCAWCRRQREVLERERMPHRIVYCDVGGSECPVRVTSYPTLVTPSGATHVGFLNARELRRLLERERLPRR